jgi:4'-phosphopantetheinyl transferase
MIIWTLATGDQSSLEKGLIRLASNVLSMDEISRAQRFQFESDRNRFILAHALCRIMLSYQGDHEPSQWEFDREIHGRPYVTNSQLALDFNLSHTSGMVGCAISTMGRVGFDLEDCRRSVDYARLAEKKFSITESKDVLSLTGQAQSDQFFRYWTLKESYIKLTGKGLREGLDSFSFDLTGTQPTCQIKDRYQDRFSFGLFFASKNHQAAWAIESDIKQFQQPEIKQLDLVEFEKILP